MRLYLAIGVAATSATFAVGQELCDAGLWDSNVDEGDFDDASNWVDGDLPDNNEVAFIGTDGAAISMTDDANVGSLTIKAQNTVLKITDSARLVIGKNTQAICYESDCSAESITVPDGYVADPVNPSVLVDPSSGEEVDADASITFNVTCAQFYVATSDVANELVNCPFEDSYSSFDSLECSLYESTWCSAGVWVGSGDGDWFDEDTWVGGAIPSMYDLAVLESNSAADSYEVVVDEDAAVGAVKLSSGTTLKITGSVLRIGGGDGALCNDALCNNAALLDNLDASSEFSFSTEVIGTGITYDTNTGDVSASGQAQAFNVSCSEGYTAQGEPSMIVTCDSFDAYEVADVNSTLQCVKDIYRSSYCSAAVVDDTGEVDWSDNTTWAYGTPPSRHDLAVLTNGGEADDLTVVLSENVIVGELVISGDTSLEITANMELKGEPLCSTATCPAHKLLDSLPGGYQAEPIGSGLELDLNTMEIEEIHRGYNISCSAYYSAEGSEASTIVSCDEIKAFHHAADEVNETLQCVPEKGEYCSGAMLVADEDADWANEASWAAGAVPSAVDVVLLDTDEVLVSINEDVDALRIIITGELTLTIEDDARVVLGEEEGFCSSFGCSEDDLEVPTGYQLTPLDDGYTLRVDELDISADGRAYLFECKYGYESMDDDLQNVTVSCEGPNSFRDFDITEYLTCESTGETTTTAPDCASCLGKSCDAWFEEELISCSELESDYDCDCSGCNCEGDCTSNCFEKNCDEWESDFGATCGFLEDSYQCDCNGCKCEGVLSYDCPSTCFDLTCTEMVAAGTDLTFQTLEEEYLCDCSGCTTTTSTTSTTTTSIITTSSAENTGFQTCTDNCFNYNCDVVIGYGYTCEQLESGFDCDCGGCSCVPVTTTTSTAVTTTTTTTTTTQLTECGVRILDQYLDAGTADVDMCVDIETIDGACPGCENLELDGNEVVQVHWNADNNYPLYLTSSLAVYEACDLDSATELELPSGTASFYNFNASEYSDGVYYLMGGGYAFGIVQYCGVYEQKIRIIVGTVADGCMNSTACNYDEDNVVDTQDACTFHPDEIDCNGVCLVDFDTCGVCAGSGVGGSQSGVDGSYIDPDHGTLANQSGTVGGCFRKGWVGDGNCDDKNNNCMCGWDGGDCCGTANSYAYCTACECVDPTFVAPAPEYCGRACWKSTYASDGFCDDANNFCGCDWDGGDCCGDANNYNFCTDCECLDENFVVPAPSPSDGCVLRCGGTCTKPAFVSDGVCDDSNNNCGCDWDGGDCCGIDNSYAFCTDCECLDCNFTPESDDCAPMLNPCKKAAWQGDGNCDDVNNLAGCDWDGGDCCGPDNVYLYCTDCECLDCTYEPDSDACIDAIVGKCGKGNYVGDGFCDDGNNNAGCGWDDGDCCGIDNNYDFCTDCLCLNCTYPVLSDECTDSIVGGCGAKNYQGDGFCDDNNNNAGCDWDLGDCCDPEADKKFCDDCACKDCTYVFEGDACVNSIVGVCGAANYQGDGFCDDNNNNAGCAWDGGDCCGVEVDKSWCDACECLNCTYVGAVGDCVDSIQGSCGASKFVGDGYCDDNNNNAGCDWDEGDCCGPENSYQFCNTCECLDCNYVAAGDDCVASFQEDCKNANFQGDGMCDDGNNVGGCDWDGGDCCGPSVKTTYCTDCECLDCTYEPEFCGASCAKQNLYNDGFCDDGNNNCGCGWDGGDCCGSSGKNKQYNYCDACECVDPDYETGGCTAPCWKSSFQGDGFCDDNNNICGCDWDGGDCCSGKTNYCTDCLCLDPDFGSGECSGACWKKAYQGDGFCDDNNNLCGCDWDGGDCCGDSGKGKQYNFCSDCECLDSNPPTTPASGDCTAACGKGNFVGDGFCDDSNNNCGCDWDEGDCCGVSGKGKQYNYCTECACLDPSKADGCAGACLSPNFVGDGFCDDGNNVCGCDWDEGDCCGDSGKGKQYNYCTECACLDPDSECMTACGSAAYQGDGFCDDDNNACGCDWDGGDCCGDSGKGKQYNYCTDCDCLDPEEQSSCPGTSTCGSGNYVGDGFCDDNNNNCGCDWDQGDCCGDSGKGKQYNYCSACDCLDPSQLATTAAA